MKLSDFVAQRIFELKIKHVFMVTGGGAMHLNHSFGTHPGLEVVYNHHEQACSIAAESYYRVNNELAVCNVTSGPGGTNAITGVHGAFVDSIGMLVVSGQVKYETTVKSTKICLRQYGDQELDIVNLVKPITKYSVMITDPLDIKYELEKAIYLAKNGRPGPCWIDIPVDIQSANINPDELKSFLPNPSIVNKNLLNDIKDIYYFNQKNNTVYKNVIDYSIYQTGYVTFTRSISKTIESYNLDNFMIYINDDAKKIHFDSMHHYRAGKGNKVFGPDYIAWQTESHI
jgi:thiamine pyrophosphate-dependent acetolactate synthase large subunit-like protein